MELFVVTAMNLEVSVQCFKAADAWDIKIHLGVFPKLSGEGGVSATSGIDLAFIYCCAENLSTRSSTQFIAGGL